jgi:hypothetical protein
MTTDQATASAGTQGVLDQMTASIMARKAQAKTTLTPVGLEARNGNGILPNTQAAFPNDHPIEAIESAIREIRTQMTAVLAGLDAVGEMRSQVANIEAALAAVESVLGTSSATAPDPAAVRQTKERAADERIAAAKAAEPAEEIAETLARIDAKSTAAKVATFGWKCPVHGKTETRTSRKGRKYQACPTCDEFERLT